MTTTSPAAAPGGHPLLKRRAFNLYALALALLVHLALLTSAMRWHAELPALPRPKPASTEVALLPPKPPPPKPVPATPAPERPAARPLEQRLTLPPPPALQRESLSPMLSTPTTSPAPADGLPSPVAAVGLPGTGGTGTAATGAATGTAGSKLFEDCADSPDRRMVAEVYRLPEGTRSVTAMQARKPIKTVCLAQLDITPRNFREGFPGMENVIEWFGLDIRFTVNVAEPGVWDVMLLSDDGAILTIDDVEVINNDGIHAAVALEASVRMGKGPRNFRVRYFQGPREGVALMLAWKRPGAADYQYLPRSLIGRPLAKDQGQ